MIDWLSNQWFDLSSKYTNDDALISTLWVEIHDHYTSKKRFYHTLSHIHSMLINLHEIKDSIVNFDSVTYAIWYHDIIYNVTKNNNEEQSAKFAKKRLKLFLFDPKQVKKIEKLIISTKIHQIINSENSDNASLLDLDLLILGSGWETYLNYSKNIRKEYAIYPDFIYKKGRKKVLKSFLDREYLYFTNHFRNTHEEQARLNLKRELDSI